MCCDLHIYKIKILGVDHAMREYGMRRDAWWDANDGLLKRSSWHDREAGEGCRCGDTTTQIRARCLEIRLRCDVGLLELLGFDRIGLERPPVIEFGRCTQIFTKLVIDGTCRPEIGDGTSAADGWLKMRDHGDTVS